MGFLFGPITGIVLAAKNAKGLDRVARSEHVNR